MGRGVLLLEMLERKRLGCSMYAVFSIMIAMCFTFWRPLLLILNSKMIIVDSYLLLNPHFGFRYHVLSSMFVSVP